MAQRKSSLLNRLCLWASNIWNRFSSAELLYCSNLMFYDASKLCILWLGAQTDWWNCNWAHHRYVKTETQEGWTPACLCDGWRKEEKRFLAPVKIMLLHIENQFLFLYFEMSMCCLGRNIWIIFFSLSIISSFTTEEFCSQFWEENVFTFSRHLTFYTAIPAKCLHAWVWSLVVWNCNL